MPGRPLFAMNQSSQERNSCVFGFVVAEDPGPRFSHNIPNIQLAGLANLSLPIASENCGANGKAEAHRPQPVAAQTPQDRAVDAL